MGAPPPERTYPTYALCIIQEHIRAGRYVMRQSAIDGAADLYLEPEDIRECVLGLDESCFYKTMAAEKAPGLFQDVYKTRFAGYRIYLKVQMGYGKTAIVVSFKKDGSS